MAATLGRRCAAEAIGTFFLVFAGTGAIAADAFTGGAVGHVGVSATFGLVVAAMIYAVGDVSGAHLNPAVTFGFWRAGRLPGREVLPYAASQCAAALVASLVVRWLTPAGSPLGSTTPALGIPESLVVEVVISFLLMYVILSVSTGAHEEGVTAALAVGGVVALAALFAGPWTGASMNPARSLGPALAAAGTDEGPPAQRALWLYTLGPVVGAWLAVLACRLTRGNPRPTRETPPPTVRGF